MEKEEQANKLSELRSRWASMLSKCPPKELLDIEGDVSDRANRDNIVYVYSSDVDAGDIVAGGARRAKGSLLFRHFVFYEKEKSGRERERMIDGGCVALCWGVFSRLYAGSACDFNLCENTFVNPDTRPIPLSEEEKAQRQNARAVASSEGRFVIFSPKRDFENFRDDPWLRCNVEHEMFEVFNAEGRRVGKGAVFNAESIYSTSKNIRPCSSVLSFTTNEYNPVPPLYWADRLDGKSLEDRKRLRYMKERMRKDRVIVLAYTPTFCGDFEAFGYASVQEDLPQKSEADECGADVIKEYLFTPLGFIPTSEDAPACPMEPLSCSLGKSCPMWKLAVELYPKITVEYRPRFKGDSKEPVWVLSTDAPHGEFIAYTASGEPYCRCITLYANAFWGNGDED